MSNFRVFQLLLVGSLLLTGYTVSNAQSPGTTQFKQPKSSMGLLGTFGYVVESVERGGKADLVVPEKV